VKCGISSPQKPLSRFKFTQPQPSTSSTTNNKTMHLQTVFLLPIAVSLSSPLHPRACTGPNVNAATVSLIKEFEGFVPSPAPDPIGLPTVGYGHLCQTSGCAEVPYNFPLTTSTASQLLATDLKVYKPY
jgi:lysozyme